MNVLVLVVSALLALASAQCPSVPRTGCFQSTNVDATIRSYLLGNQVDWSWTDDNEDYGVNETLPSFTNSNPLGLFTLCVYNGNTVTQTETVAPATSGNTLYSIPAILNLNLDVNPNSRRITLQTGGTARLWASFLSSSERSNAITQLIETNGRCWSKAISFVPSSLPPVKVGGYLDLNLTTSVLNRLAARYNARSNGQPLNMIAFSAALGPADLFQRHATANLSSFNLKAHLSTFHVLGWYGGLWFFRDGFGGNRPGGNIDTLDQIDTRYSSFAELVESQSL
eukprot:TRINITY_DN851_c1_g2_i4.p1 TRINITY_DN851_c1_g2~~TRINITY_DN851_c1_g2_i4.p1  ORF type:complete len:296 (-),score=48.06 TRINITY_DN851_c1_g2_i4:88-936(-)